MNPLMERFNSAIQFERNGDYQLALREYSAIIGERSDFREAYINMGTLYARMERFGEALASFGRALELAEDCATHFNMGSTLYRMGDYKKAIIALDRAKKINPDFSPASLIMGLSFSRMGNHRAAEICFRTVIRLSPDNSVALTALSILYYESRRYDEALGLLNRLIIISPNDENIRRLKARVLYRMNRVSEYAREIRQIKEVSPSFQVYDRFIRAVPVETFADRFGTLEEKVAMLKERSKDRTDLKSLISLSLCHLLSGDTDLAMEYLFEAKSRAVN